MLQLLIKISINFFHNRNHLVSFDRLIRVLVYLSDIDGDMFYVPGHSLVCLCRVNLWIHRLNLLLGFVLYSSNSFIGTLALVVAHISANMNRYMCIMPGKDAYAEALHMIKQLRHKKFTVYLLSLCLVVPSESSKSNDEKSLASRNCPVCSLTDSTTLKTSE
jgi:hypothetical protein